jgi:hypothetical protein
MTDDVERELRAQQLYERLDGVIQALGALKAAIDDILEPEEDE